MELSRISSLLIGNNFVNSGNSSPSILMSLKPFIPSALASPDTLFSVKIRPFPFQSGINNISFFSKDEQLQQKQNESLNSARTEWQNGVRENLGTNSGTRVNQYYKNSGFSPGGDGGWCGFFVAFNYAQSGFKNSPQLAGMEKGKNFFMYRQYTDQSTAKNAKLDSLKQEQQMQGSQRQYFMLEESPNLNYIKNYKNIFKNYDADANTFNYRTLPIRPGDTVLFQTGNPGGHVGMVESYDPNSGKLTTIEGNASGRTSDGKIRSGNAVTKKEYDLTNPTVRAKFDGFGRPALGDFQ